MNKRLVLTLAILSSAFGSVRAVAQDTAEADIAALRDLVQQVKQAADAATKAAEKAERAAQKAERLAGTAESAADRGVEAVSSVALQDEESEDQPGDPLDLNARLKAARENVDGETQGTDGETEGGGDPNARRRATTEEAEDGIGTAVGDAPTDEGDAAGAEVNAPDVHGDAAGAQAGTGTPTRSFQGPIPETLGLKDYVKERRKFFRIPEFDIDEPDKTAGELQRFYAELAADIKSVSAFTSGADVQKRVDEVLSKHKAAIAPILDQGRVVEVNGKTQHARRADWEPLVKDTFAHIQQLVNDDKFNAEDPRYWEKGFSELSDGYGDIEVETGNERDLTPAERRQMAASGYAAASGSGGSYGASLGALWHARRMAHIRWRHERRMARIRAISP